MNAIKILIVEDEHNLGTSLSEYLQAKGQTCIWADTAKIAEKMFKENLDISVVLMDIGLPDGNGIELAKSFRKQRKNFCLLFLSAQNDPQTRLEGLELGADDYITKPFDLRELNLRLNRIFEMKKHFSYFQEEIIIGELSIWFKRYELKAANGMLISLSQKECGILELLYRHKNEVVSREKIINDIWGVDAYPSNRTVDNYIVKLRKWTETDKSQKIKIISARGVGYKLELKE
jgi:two-component system, OmpR family, alkaline phosphatase synthesis response regulator PhoP